MREQLRRQYLDAMGVASYVPRVLLPGAKPSVLLHEPAAAPDAHMPPDVGREAFGASHQPDTALGSRSLDKLFDLEPAKPVSRAAAPAPAPAARRSSESDAPQFALSLLRTVERPGQSYVSLLIVDEAVDEPQQPDYLRLLQNMLRALGFGAQALRLDPFIWPGDQSGLGDVSEQTAREMLQGYLLRQIEDSGDALVLVLGETAARYAAPALSTDGTRLLQAVSARRALIEPAFKRQLWRDLQSLLRV